MNARIATVLLALAVAAPSAMTLRASRAALQSSAPDSIDPTTLLWYRHPAQKWENALPVGNGRLGAMVFGRTDEERIQINEDTYWTGGPYTTTVTGGAAALPDVRRLIFAGDLIAAHRLFGRRLMGYPIEQQKYQSLGDIILTFRDTSPVAGYRHQLDLDTAVDTTRYEQDGTTFVREVFVSPIDQVIVVRLTADRPAQISFDAQLRGARNTAHSNYATDYFHMDGDGNDGLVVRGKSADYLGVEGRLRYESRLKAFPDGGEMRVTDDTLIVRGADSVTLYVTAATNFVSYKDVSGDPAARVGAALSKMRGQSYDAVKARHVDEHRRLFRRVRLNLGTAPDSSLATDERLRKFDGANDPALPALLFQFGRYLLISSSRPGSQPANLQGIWNDNMNPPWDSKYTTNINTEMNYWAADAVNLGECADPLFRMIRELTDQGSDVAREYYGARGWVMHQNTDLWRVAAPMDGPSWGAFTTGGAWLTTHLWEHYAFSRDRAFLREYYPVMKGAVQFFLDFLVTDPKRGWLVTNPSTSPENFPLAPGNDPFFDEVTMFTSPGTTLTAGSTIDLEILHDLFAEFAQASQELGVDADIRLQVEAAKKRLAPLQVGSNGALQEWLDDWGQREKSHRHISNVWGVYPGHTITVRDTPALADASRRVLEQRGLTGNGWSSAWKAAAWARLRDGENALANIKYAIAHYTTDSLFSICSEKLQVDGAFGMTAAVAELLLQSDEGAIDLLPSLPAGWTNGEIRGLRARGGYEVGLVWDGGRLTRGEIKSTAGGTCRVRATVPLDVTSSNGIPVRATHPEQNVVQFETTPGASYQLTARRTPGSAMSGRVGSQRPPDREQW